MGRIAIALLVILGGARGGEPDADGDGLPDLAERHKYFTDPTKADSDGDGKPDGDWDERREYTYSIRSVVRVMPPYNKDALNDDYQDVRVRAENERYVELEVVHYPLNTWAESIVADPDWRKAAAALGDDVRAGVTTNWDAEMSRRLARELAERGIDAATATDRDLAVGASRWLLERGTYRSMFCTFYVDFPRGEPRVAPGLEARFEQEKGDPSWSVREEFEHELFGRGMFENRSYGSCTSTAVYLTTGLRALGLPTRMVLAIPVVDASDPAQLQLVRDHLAHHRVRNTTFLGLRGLGTSFSSHTYNEVYVGGRWRRLNYGKLGQNIHDRHLYGLVTHIHRFRDLSEAGLAATWGRRYALGERSEDFPFANPYRTLELDDRFGAHANVPNPEEPLDATTEVTIARAYWYADRPAGIQSSWMGKDDRGYLILHLERHADDLREFLKLASPDFALVAEGHADVPARGCGNWWIDPAKDHREICLLIEAADYARMAKGVAYALRPRNRPGFTWTVAGGVVIRR